MKEDRNHSDDLGTTDSSPDYITLVMLQVYSALWGSPTVMLSVEEKDEIGVQIEKIIQIEIYRSFESSGVLLEERLSNSSFTVYIQVLQNDQYLKIKYIYPLLFCSSVRRYRHDAQLVAKSFRTPPPGLADQAPPVAGKLTA